MKFTLFPQVKRLPLQGALITTATVIYCGVFLAFYPTRGAVISSLSVLPVIVAGWILGVRGGLVAGLLTMPLSMLLLLIVGEPTWANVLMRGAFGFVAVFVVGVVVGRLHDLEVKVRQELTERKQMESELTSLYRATSFLFESSSLLNLGLQIVQAVVQEFHHSDCGLLIVDQKQNRMIRLARNGEYQINTTTVLYLDDQGLISEVVRTGKTIYIPDVKLDPRYLMDDARTRSELIIPLHNSKGVLGVLDLQSPQPNAFSQKDQRVLVAFAERAAAALENRLLYEQLNQHASELEWRVAKRTTELGQAKDHAEAILNNSSDAVVLIDGAARIQQTNHSFSQLFGYMSDETFRNPLFTLIAMDNIKALDDMLPSVVEGRQPARIEVICRRKDGRIFDADLALAPLLSEHGTSKIICSFRDITERKRAEDDLRRALESEKALNDLKSRFTSMVSHEFRNPLTVILSSTSLLQDYFDKLSEDKRQKHFSQIRTQVVRLVNLLDDMLTLSRAETVTVEVSAEPLDLKVLCDDIVNEIQPTTQKHQIEVVVTGACGMISMDTKLMRQAITNLLSNAVKYSPRGGKVILDLVFEERQITIRVQDKGIGIPEADQQRLFESFHRAENVGTILGTGLGLSIVKRAVEAHRGTITVESKIGIGTTFTIHIPVSYSVIQNV